jgi:Xaa-Pro aminopeptidase
MGKLVLSIAETLAALRQRMQQEGLSALLVTSADEHLNEYLPPHRLRRQWVTGFTGSVGDFLLTAEQAWLFVDSRYYLQADQQVDPTLITVIKLGLNTMPTLVQQLGFLAHPGFTLGVDPFTVSVRQGRQLEKAVRPGQLVRLIDNWVDGVCPPVPAPAEPVYAFHAAGATVEEKLARVRADLKGATVLPITKLDQIAWLFNLRGSDVPYNPVFLSYAIVTPDKAMLFTDAPNVTVPGVTVLPYSANADALMGLGGVTLIDPEHTTLGTEALVTESKEAPHPVQQLKAIKNSAELAGMRRANFQASRAKIRALCWLEHQLNKGATVTEADLAETIERFYAEEPGFISLSFNTIAGTGANSAIVHYGTPDPTAVITPGSWVLLDSGAQYADDQFGGTTDDTRTVVMGRPDTTQRRHFTAVLRAHIACASQRFPRGTDGTRLDGITRAPLWQQGLDYGHGTGHGVGAFLNVHEGPNGIHKMAATGLEPGMITSIEPGYYEAGWGGIRLENLYEVVADDKTPGWCHFEPLTWVPFHRNLIDKVRLLPHEKRWLGDYHRRVYTRLAPTLTNEERRWLRKQTWS